jgi:hypothetical protein
VKGRAAAGEIHCTLHRSQFPARLGTPLRSEIWYSLFGRTVWEDQEMAGFSFTCPCGHQIKVDAGSRNDAVGKMQGMMDEKAIAAHFKERHPGQAVMPVAAVHGLIAERTVSA